MRYEVGRGRRTLDAPSPLPSFQKPNNGAADAAICAFNHRLPAALNVLPSRLALDGLTLSALSVGPGASASSASSSRSLMRAGLIVGEIVDILSIGVGHCGNRTASKATAELFASHQVEEDVGELFSTTLRPSFLEPAYATPYVVEKIAAAPTTYTTNDISFV